MIAVQVEQTHPLGIDAGRPDVGPEQAPPPSLDPALCPVRSESNHVDADWLARRTGGTTGPVEIVTTAAIAVGKPLVQLLARERPHGPTQRQARCLLRQIGAGFLLVEHQQLPGLHRIHHAPCKIRAGLDTPQVTIDSWLL
jgi:hypothetical protein